MGREAQVEEAQLMSAPRSGRRRLWIAGAFAAALLALAVPYASAVHDEGLFELDANAFGEAAAGDDWDTLVGGGGSANVFNMTQDPVESSADDIFDGGQSKDTSDIDAWSWKGAEPNDKNDIQHAFAAAYEDPDNGHLIVYFGLDRLDSSGDAAAGFWFLKRPVEQVTINGKNVFVYKGTNTLAEHSVGDVLVQSDFTNGGVVERIDSYGWGVAPAGSQVQPGSPLRLIAEGADCDDDAEPPELCGQVNDGGEDVPANWPGSVNPAGSVKFKGPGGVSDSTVFNDATFLEGGIDLTSLFGRNVCTAQFIAETRQSQSETAVLEDKVEGDFALCDIEVTKSGPEKSKVGDDATYEVEVKNTGAVTLFKQSIEDTLAGDLTDGTNPAIVNSTCGESLAPDETCTIEYTYTVQAGDPDPLPNTVDIEYNRDEELTGDSVTDSASHEVNLFQPSITFEKTGDALSKIGDTVDYTLTLNNTSSDDSPDLECTISDPTVGVDEDVTLASGASEVIDVTDFEIPAGAADPFPNTATATCSPEGFPNVLEASDGHSVNLFQPSITVEKQAGNPFSKAGDDVTYTVKISNTSSADSPDLVIESIDDSLQGDLTDPGNVDSSDCGPSLASATSCTIEYTRTVVAGDPEILTNTVSVKTHPDGFANDIDASDAVDVDILHPSYTVAKDCKSGTEPVPQQGPAVFTVTITNTGDADLVITANDGIGQVSLAAGATQSFTVTINGPFTGQATVENTVNTTAVLAAQYGLPNTLQGNATGDCRVASRVKVKKLTSGVVNPSQNWTFQLFNAGPHGDDSDSSFLGSPLATATTLGDGDGVLDFGNINLDPTKTYTLCERDVPSGWTVIWKVDTNGDGTPDTTVSPFNPNSKDVPPADLGNRCFDFGAGTGYPLPAGGTLAFEINNTRPGGQPRTIGYWKNWSSCTGGNQVQTAAKNGGVAAGFFLLDNVLPITIGSYTIPAANTVESGTNKTGCQIAVLLLGKSDKKTGKNMANDAAYGLAAQLIAAKANLKAGAVNCPALTTAIASADSLLTSINFTGTGEYLGPKVKGALATTRTQALSLAATLDQYNNGNLC